MKLLDTLKPIFSARFIKFGIVGASGVLVNLGVLAVLTGFGVRSTVASAGAIQVSILSNFLVNELWTFRDQRDGGSLGGRIVRFQLVSLVGAAIQWTVFLIGLVLWLRFVDSAAALTAYFGELGPLDSLIRLIVEPPDVGWGVYPAQLAGIGVATGWNFLANFYWTWRKAD